MEQAFYLSPAAEPQSRLPRQIEIETPVRNICIATRRGKKHAAANGDTFKYRPATGHYGTIQILIGSDGSFSADGDPTGKQSSQCLIDAADQSIDEVLQNPPADDAKWIPTIFDRVWQKVATNKHHDATLAVLLRKIPSNTVLYGSLGSTLVCDFDNSSKNLQVLSQPPLAVGTERGALGIEDVIYHHNPTYPNALKAITCSQTLEEALASPYAYGIDPHVLEKLWEGRSGSVLMDADYRTGLSHGVFQGQPGHICMIATDGVMGPENLTIPSAEKHIGQLVARASSLDTIATTLLESADGDENKRNTLDDQSIALLRIPIL